MSINGAMRFRVDFRMEAPSFIKNSRIQRRVMPTPFGIIAHAWAASQARCRSKDVINNNSALAEPHDSLAVLSISLAWHYTFRMMRDERTNQPYESALPYVASRVHAAAIYCSDGRVGEHFDDFLQKGLSLPRYDRVALPGGPACLAGHPQAHLEEQGVVDELQFLVEAHGLKRIVLIAHQGCAFYEGRLELDGRRLELVQRADLVRAAAVVRRVTGVDAVEGYFARLAEHAIRFEPVEV